MPRPPRRPLLGLAAATALGAAAAAGAAAETVCFVPYREFEEAIRHFDIQTCPDAAVKPEEGFCRLGLEGDSALLYVFRHIGGEPCLTRIERRPFAEFVARFGPTYTRP
jgi:hypothetical protein